jgi:hypothetical protein
MTAPDFTLTRVRRNTASTLAFKRLAARKTQGVCS